MASTAEPSSEAVRELTDEDPLVTVSMSSVSRSLLQGDLPDFHDSPHVGLAVVMRLLLHSEVAVAPQVLQRWVLPTLRTVLSEAGISQLMRILDAWAHVLNKDPRASLGSAPSASQRSGAAGGNLNDRRSNDTASSGADVVLRHCAFGSAALLKDAATVLLALVAHLELRLFERSCPQQTAALVTEALCLRMFTRIGGMQLQSISCEAFALAFPIWRPHVSSSLPKRPGAAPGAPRSGNQLSLPAKTGSSGTDGQGEASRSPSPQPDQQPQQASQQLGAPDEDLARLTIQVLALYQEPRVSPSCLAVMMQVGNADPGTLLHVMGKAARRLDLGASYASSALLVLVAFIHRSAAKVLPLLPRFTEAVLRCLEPSDPSLRRQSLLAVTSALHELVQTYPMVAFHQPSQKFAVGTGEGIVIVYDLRTATKWRIFEGHTGSVSALAFSRDGDRLSSYCSRDCTLRLWQCSSTGFLGGLLGSSGRCLKQHGLPPCCATDLSPTAKRNCSPWRSVNLSWTERGHLRLVRESGETVHMRPD